MGVPGGMRFVCGALALFAAIATATAADAPRAKGAAKMAVFPFELENTSPTGTAWGETSKDSPAMKAITEAVRREVSAKYRLVDVSGADSEEARSGSLRTCHGCDADIARRLGADRSMIGVVSRAGSTEYYVAVRVTDAVRHEVVFQKMAFFIGGEDSWPTGVHEVVQQALAAAEAPAGAR